MYFGKSHHRYFILPGQGTCPLLRIRTLSETQIHPLKTVILVNIRRICPQMPIWHQTILHYDRSFFEFSENKNKEKLLSQNLELENKKKKRPTCSTEPGPRGPRKGNIGILV